MFTNAKRKGTGVMSFNGRAYLFAAFLAGTLTLFTGCNEIPILPERQFAENYLQEQTYSHCKRYQRMTAINIYGCGLQDHYVFFSKPALSGHSDWKVKTSRGELNFSGVFRRYDQVGHIYHELINYEFSPAVKTDSAQYPYSSTMKIEYTCIDKLYHDDSEYNAGIIWIYDKSKYNNFTDRDLQNQLMTLWPADNDMQLLTKRMNKDTAASKTISHKVPLRYDVESESWQWQSANGRWNSRFEAVQKLAEIPLLSVPPISNKGLSELLSPGMSNTHKVQDTGHSSYLYAVEFDGVLRNTLRGEYLFLCPGKDQPYWIKKDQHNASSRLLAQLNEITIRQKKVSSWELLQALNKHHNAITPIQDLIWDKAEKSIKKNIELICDTDFLEYSQKKNYMKRFFKRLDQCRQLQDSARFIKIKTFCQTKLDQLNPADDK